MSAETVKQEIIELAKKIKDETITDDELVSFFRDHRIEFMEAPTGYTQEEWDKRDNSHLNVFSYPPPGYIACLTCSCGSTEVSCAEDGPGTYSQFYINPEGNILRIKVLKEI